MLSLPSSCACSYKEHLVKKSLTSDLPDGFKVLPDFPNDWDAKSLESIGGLCETFEVVGLGETHHTSAGFYKAKIAIIKYLITEKKFRALAFEDNWSSALAINDYLLGLEDDPKSALLSLYGVWHDEAILDLIKWIRKYNDLHPNDKVVFFGFDMQDPEYAKSYLTKKENKYKNIAEITIDSFDKRARCRGTRTIDQGPESDDCLKIRDQAMAEIFLHMKSKVALNKRAIIWAANGHIQKEIPGAPMQTSMGYFLSQKISKKYGAILVIASQYLTHPKWEKSIPSQIVAPEGSLEQRLEPFCRGSLFVDFQKLNLEVLGFQPEQAEEINLLLWANGVVYLKKSEPMILVE